VPLRRAEDAALATLSELALVLLYLGTLVVKTCDAARAACTPYGFGDRPDGVFLFFLFFGLATLLLQLIFEAAALVYGAQQQRKLRRLRYRGGGFIELLPVAAEEFAHLPGLEPSPCFHLFLSHAWPLGQDVCKLIKLRCREICPSLHVFLDVEDLAKGSGTKEVDHSRCVLVFAMPVYFEKINCVKELTRAIVRHKQITLLLPDSEVHGAFTQAMISEIVTDAWVSKWKLQKKLAQWASEWGVVEVKLPTGAEIRDALFKQSPLEWSRITTFQDRTMVLMCRRLLPDADRRDIYLQGTTNFKLPKGHRAVKLYCSPHNPGARELAEELNGIWPGLLKSAPGTRRSPAPSLIPLKSSVSSVALGALGALGAPGTPADPAEVHSWYDLDECDQMLVYFNAVTWTHDPETFAAEVREALQRGVHLHTCHEFPSVIDGAVFRIDGVTGGARHAVEFKQIMDATPADLTKWPTNIYSRIAIALKGGELREPGLANLAARLAVRVDRSSRSRKSKRSRDVATNSRWSRDFTAAVIRGEPRSSWRCSTKISARHPDDGDSSRRRSSMRSSQKFDDAGVGSRRKVSSGMGRASSRHSTADHSRCDGAIELGTCRLRDDEPLQAAGAIPVDVASSV